MPRLLLPFILFAPGLPASGQDYSPKIAEASREAALAIPRFRVPDGVQVDVVAAEPDLANPVAFHIDPTGRIFVCETYRQQKGVEDNRYHMGWLHDDLAARTVADREAMFRKHLGEKASEYTTEHDRIRLLQDTDGDGRIDRSTVFADGFNQMVEGTGAGVLFRQGQVYYTCIPRLWRLYDADGDGRADGREAMHDGFGVRVAFRGHDMHGLTMGPDGRLYFSIGDRGYNVTTTEGEQLERPDTGAVFRCEPDGSHLEVFAYGLRNPQELAFDDWGNLFTGDNNSDSGDLARWVYVVQGSDSGWRMYFQYLEDRGPWNRERMWYPYRADDETSAVQPAFIVPPVANIADGPSGLTYYPGVGLSSRYAGHFFLADFRGTAGTSGIRSFAVEPRGASFELVDSHEFLWSILATDVDFGYSGGLYVTDWVNGWEGEGKGRLYRFRDTAHQEAVRTADSARLMQRGFAETAAEDLVGLLQHPDKRIRQEAQFELVRRERMPALSQVAESAEAQRLARVHAIWGLGQLGRLGTPNQASSALTVLTRLLRDSDSELRAQSVRTIADLCGRRGIPEPTALRQTDRRALRKAVRTLVTDDSPRVRGFATMALGVVGDSSDIPRLLEVLSTNNGEDAVIRHAAVMGLVGVGQPGELVAAAKTAGSEGRLGVVLALRRLHAAQVQHFLADPDPAVAVEAARAIHDESIDEAMPALAALASRPGVSPPLLRRAMSACFRDGTLESATTVAGIATRTDLDTGLRAEAVAELLAWNDPSPLDRVDGRWRPLSRESSIDLSTAVRPALPGILAGTPELRDDGIRLAAQYGVTEVAPLLRRMLRDTAAAAETREAALRALDQLNDPQLEDGLQLALATKSVPLRNAAREIMFRRDPAAGETLLIETLGSGRPREQQAAIRLLATTTSPRADQALLMQLRRLIEGNAPTETALDLLEAAAKRDTPELRRELARYDAARSATDPLARFRECLSGGDARNGRAIFFGRTAASCRRCHKVGDEGGAVGPDLTKIAEKNDREYLLEAIVDPNRRIAKGFETVVLVLETGKVYTGIVREETDDVLRLMDNNGATVVVRKDEIEDRAQGESGMPADLIKHLSKSDLRDLVEYLSRRK